MGRAPPRPLWDRDIAWEAIFTLLDEAILSLCVEYPTGLHKLLRAGVRAEHLTEDFRPVWSYINRSKRDHDAVPDAEVLMTRFPDLELQPVKKASMRFYVEELFKRHQYLSVMRLLERAVGEMTEWDDTARVAETIQRELNTITTAANGHQKAHIVDLFGADIQKRMIEELKRRRERTTAGIPTGFTTFDELTGGLQKQTMFTIISRSGVGKSWITLFSVANAVMTGHRVMLFPLEMSLEQTAFRLYTIFSQKCFGAGSVLQNNDLNTGRVTVKRLVKFFNSLEDRFKGQLYVADIREMGNGYTAERIESEVRVHKPDMFFVDYLTLMAGGGGNGRTADDWQTVRQHSNGIKNCAMRTNTVGGAAAQVNRVPTANPKQMPRLEHISLSDSVGQDSDQVIAMTRQDENLFFALIKNRNGPLIKTKRMMFKVNEGLLEEVPDHSDSEE